jgi:hypothetical protein
MDLTEVKDRVKDLPIEDVIGSELTYVGKKPLCPFHDDHRPGSFVVNKRKNTWACYSCGKRGDAIHFVQERFGLDFLEATSKIAIEHGIVTKTEMEHILNSKLSDNHERKATYKKRDAIIRPERADIDTLHKAYSIFAHGMEIINKPILRDSQRKTLREHYGLTDDEIARDGLFSWPSNHVAKKLFTALRENGITDKELSLIPGMFYNKDTESWDFYRPNNTGAIGVPIRNIDGKIQGFQIRLDRKKEGAQRYQWFSSAFADGYNTPYIYGTSPGSPIDVVYPKEVKTATVFVTEGHFKAIKLANQFNSIALSVQGVSNWRQIPAVIDELNRRHPKLRHVYIAYDADMAYKDTVLSPAMKLGLTLTGLSFEGVKDAINDILTVGYREEEYSNLYAFKRSQTVSDYLVRHPVHKYIVTFCLWDDKYGKGIDDLINSGHIADIKKMSLIPFWNHAFRFLQASDQLRKEISEDNNQPFKETTLTEEQKRNLFQQHIFAHI